MNAATSGNEPMLNKVPQLTIYFWIIKIMATTVGETVADMLAVKLNLGLVIASVVVGVMLLIALYVQFRSRKYLPAFYWLAVVLISVAGTLITDNLVENLGVPLWVTTVVFTVALCLTFVAWYAVEKSPTGRRFCSPSRSVPPEAICCRKAPTSAICIPGCCSPGRSRWSRCCTTRRVSTPSWRSGSPIS
jgi:uncharacterized membrane-anchored protein